MRSRREEPAGRARSRARSRRGPRGQRAGTPRPRAGRGTEGRTGGGPGEMGELPPGAVPPCWQRAEGRWPPLFIAPRRCCTPNRCRGGLGEERRHGAVPGGGTPLRAPGPRSASGPGRARWGRAGLGGDGPGRRTVGAPRSRCTLRARCRALPGAAYQPPAASCSGSHPPAPLAGCGFRRAFHCLPACGPTAGERWPPSWAGGCAAPQPCREGSPWPGSVGMAASCQAGLGGRGERDWPGVPSGEEDEVAGICGPEHESRERSPSAGFSQPWEAGRESWGRGREPWPHGGAKPAVRALSRGTGGRGAAGESGLG